MAAVVAAATPGVAEHDAVAGRQVGDVGPDGLDDPGALVAEHDRQLRGRGVAGDDEIGVADAAGDDAYEHLVGAWRLELGALQREPPARHAQDRCSDRQRRVLRHEVQRERRRVVVQPRQVEVADLVAALHLHRAHHERLGDPPEVVAHRQVVVAHRRRERAAVLDVRQAGAAERGVGNAPSVVVEADDRCDPVRGGEGLAGPAHRGQLVLDRVTEPEHAARPLAQDLGGEDRLGVRVQLLELGDRRLLLAVDQLTEAVLDGHRHVHATGP